MEHLLAAHIHKARYIQTSDPGAVGAGVEWLDTNFTPAKHKKRNAGNTDWDEILDPSDYALLAGATFTGDVVVPDEAYDATAWNGSLEVPTKNAVRDKIESMAGGGDAQTANPLSQFAATTSAQLAGVLSDETGTGLAVFNDAPTLVNPVVGTQSVNDNTTKGASTAYADRAAESKLTPWVTLSDGATITWDVAGKREAKAKVTLGGNRTLDIDNAADGAAGILIVTQDGTGSRTLTLPAGSIIVGGGGTSPSLSTDDGAIDILAFEFDGTTFYWTLGRGAA